MKESQTIFEKNGKEFFLRATQIELKFKSGYKWVFKLCLIDEDCRTAVTCHWNLNMRKKAITEILELGYNLIKTESF